MKNLSWKNSVKRAILGPTLVFIVMGIVGFLAKQPISPGAFLFMAIFTSAGTTMMHDKRLNAAAPVSITLTSLIICFSFIFTEMEVPYQLLLILSAVGLVAWLIARLIFGPTPSH